MFDTFEENEPFGEGIVTQDNQLLSFNAFFPFNSTEEKYDNDEFFLYENKNKEKTIPASLDKIKIDFKSIEETNTKTLSPPEFYSLEKIKGVLEKNSCSKQIIDKLDKGNSINMSDGYVFMSMSPLSKKRKREENDNILFYEEIIKDEKNEKYRGRKTENRPIKRHGKMAADNIIKKNKAKLFDYCLQFLNSLLEKMNLKVMLFKLDYRYIDQLKCENEFQLLKSLLKDIYSLDVSRKYSQKDKDYNKRVIKKLIKSEKILNERNLSYYDTLMFVLNITFSGWLDVFTGKKTFENLQKDYTGDQEKINFGLIKTSFVGVNNLLTDLLKKNENKNEIDDKYFALFVFYLYNYERWFFIRALGNKKKKEK